MRAVSAKTDMRRGNIRRHLFPRKVANYVARIAALLRRELLTCATKPLLVLSLPVRPTKPDLWRPR
jgi:hypothetical protein